VNSAGVLVGLSGGVDSAVAAALLRDAGYAVETACLRLHSGERTPDSAAAVAETLGVPFRVIDRRRRFGRCVIENFVREYARGRTPNPCVMCNPGVKFSALLEEADRDGIEFVASGHYARVAPGGENRGFTLNRGVDPLKDQSYFLHRLDQSVLARLRLPLGGLTKTEVRTRARALNLPAADRTDSQEICFIPDRDYARFLRERAPGAFQPGPILDQGGRELGRHEGIAHFTVGQRRGLGIAAPHPLYVIEIRTGSRAVVAGPREALYSIGLDAESPHWLSGAAPSASLSVRAQIRYRHAPADARLEVQGTDRVRVRFERAQRAVTPGQAVVFYREDEVLGGAVISSTRGGNDGKEREE